MGKLMIFSVSDVHTGEVLFTGTAKQCLEKFGVPETTFRQAAINCSVMRNRYVVAPVNADEIDNAETVPNGEAARKWDEFCEPIRKKYGIPVYKAKPEVRG